MTRVYQVVKIFDCMGKLKGSLNSSLITVSKLGQSKTAKQVGESENDKLKQLV